MTLFAAGARLSRRRFVYPLIAIAAALAAAIAVTLSLAAGAAAATIPAGARVVTVTPVFGQDPDVSRHHLDHAFTITDPARVARIAAIIDGLARFPIGELSCARDNGAEMQLTFRTSPGGRVLATVLATYTGCPLVWNTDARTRATSTTTPAPASRSSSWSCPSRASAGRTRRPPCHRSRANLRLRGAGAGTW